MWRVWLECKRRARMFLEELASGAHVAQEIVLPSRRRYDDNLARFQHAFAKFPEANDNAYIPAPSRPKVKRVAEKSMMTTTMRSTRTGESIYREAL